ncbi:MAG: asparaginase domain-containing protein, partial [Polyangiaceae bacterium]
MRILLLHTGGTLMMRTSGSTPLKPAMYTRDLVGELPMLNKIADIDTEILLQLDSSDMQPENWVDIARAVHEHIADYDGIVLVHGTDTMA